MNTPLLSVSTILKNVNQTTLLALTLIMLWPLPHKIIAQNDYWKDVSNQTAPAGISEILPQKYRLLKLEVDNLKKVLQKSPMEFTDAAQNSSVQVELPMPDGTTQTFLIYESPVMDAKLAAKYPEIKTYAGYSVDNKAISVRIDLTPAGFHAMVLSPEETYFIDPYSQDNTSLCMSYFKKDFLTTKTFNCGVKGDTSQISNEKGTPKPIDIPKIGNLQFGDNRRRTYRLAVAATGEYTTFHGGTVAKALAAQVTTMNRVNGIYIRDFSVSMRIIDDNDQIIYTNAATDPYTNNDRDAMFDENQTNLTSVIGGNNYDIGHVFGTGGDGVASLGSVCSATRKARGVTGSATPRGDAFDIDYVAHEMGHQFGGNHTFNNSCSGNRDNGTAWEPGSGSTIMGYAGICAPNIQARSDAYFHGGSLDEMYVFITGTGNACAASTIPVNAAPVIASSTPNQAIPKGTPFFLTGVANDADGNASLTYCWEQMNNQISTQAPISTSTGGPNFRSYSPSPSGVRYFPRLSDLATNATTTWEVLPTVGRTLNFRLVVRDNSTVAGFNDRTDVAITVDANSGPLVVTSPTTTGVSWRAFSSQTVTWNVANTTAAPVSCANVDILLSTDGGLTYPTTLAANVPNSGMANITVPNLPSTTARFMVRGSGKIFFDISNNNFTITCGAIASNDSPKCTGSSLSLTSNGGGTYLWTSSNGYTSTLQNPTIGSLASTDAGTYVVKITNGTCTASATTVITTNAVLAQPLAFTTSSTSVCQGTNNVNYIIPTVAGATSYTWAYSGVEVTITGATNSVNINFSGGATSGILSVSANNICGSSVARTLSINVNTTPTTPTSFQSGSWQSVSTWQCGVIPSVSNNAILGVGHTVTIDGIMVQIKGLIYAGGTIQMLNNGILKLVSP